MISRHKKVRVHIDDGRPDVSTRLRGTLETPYHGHLDEPVYMKSITGEPIVVPARRILYVEGD